MKGERLASSVAFCLVIGLGGAALGAEGAAAGEVLIGVLTEQADMVCNGTFAPEWVRPHYEVGFVEVIPAPGLNLDAWLGKAVVVRGSPAARPAPLPEHTGSCPGEQMRSDYVRSRQGIRIKRPIEARPQAFTAASIGSFDGVEAKLVKGAIVVRLTNRLGLPLKGPEIRVHYEGCYGKPMSLHRAKKRALMQAGKFFEGRFEPWAEDPKLRKGAEHVAAAIQVVAAKGPVMFDLDLPLPKLGLQIECRTRL
jgi:hypothetical protein